MISKLQGGDNSSCGRIKGQFCLPAKFTTKKYSKKMPNNAIQGTSGQCGFSEFILAVNS
jgi:hypothetical protein